MPLPAPAGSAAAGSTAGPCATQQCQSLIKNSCQSQASLAFSASQPLTQVCQLAGLRLHLLHINLGLALDHAPPPLRMGSHSGWVGGCGAKGIATRCCDPQSCHGDVLQAAGLGRAWSMPACSGAAAAGAAAPASGATAPHLHAVHFLQRQLQLLPVHKVPQAVVRLHRRKQGAVCGRAGGGSGRMGKATLCTLPHG